MPIVYDGLAPLPKDMGIAELTRLANLRHAQARQADRAITDIMHCAISALHREEQCQRTPSPLGRPLDFNPRGGRFDAGRGHHLNDGLWMSESDMTKPDT